jgi:hypothetical protein
MSNQIAQPLKTARNRKNLEVARISFCVRDFSIFPARTLRLACTGARDTHTGALKKHHD